MVSILQHIFHTMDMMKKDSAWANAAFRVSRELDDSERSILTEMAMAFLKRRRGGGV